MHKKVFFIVAWCALMTAAAARANVVLIHVPSIAERVATADAVVVGKVESIEEKTVKAKSVFGDQEIVYQIAVVKISEGISGAKGLTQVKVAFQLPAAPGDPVIRPGRILPPKLDKDQEACLFITKHPTESFYVLTDHFCVLDKKNEGFDKQVDEAKKFAKIMDEAPKNLKSKDADERFTAATMLIVKYRTRRGGNRLEAIDADQSTAILSAIADADWTKQYPDLQDANALGCFFRLGMTEKDGWKCPQNANQQQLVDAAKAWLKDNMDNYRIQRFTADNKEEKKDK